MPVAAVALNHSARAHVERQWLTVLRGLSALFIVGSLATPVLLAAGASGLAGALYRFFHLVCHQWAFRSFFVLGPRATLSRDQLVALGVNPHTFVGDPRTGWKMALYQRDMAIFAGLLAFGSAYPAMRRLRQPAGVPQFAVLVAPMAVDGLSQHLGWRESRWELRIGTGLLFGLASGWFLYPRIAPTSLTFG